MGKRLFWLAVGVGAGVYAVRKVSRAADAFTPHGFAEGLHAVGGGLRDFADEVRIGMREREQELREALGLDGAAGESGPDRVHHHPQGRRLPQGEGMR
ncbi:MAG: DUF6167 family protein [Carbonactinosporaceae bacterium]